MGGSLKGGVRLGGARVAVWCILLNVGFGVSNPRLIVLAVVGYWRA